MTDSVTDPDARVRWWPRGPQRDWRRLPVAEVDWLAVWNVNLGGGKQAFSVRNRYWGDHPFRAGTVSLPTAWVWHADDTPVPSSWAGVHPLAGIPNRISVTKRGVPMDSGIVLVPRTDAFDDLVALAATFDAAVTEHGGAWCPALVGRRTGARLGISHQRSVDPTAALDTALRLGIDDVVVVDAMHELGYATVDTPRVLVEGRADGTGRRARAGREAIAEVPVPDEVHALRRIDLAWVRSRGARPDRR